jgi:hypothetical protein
MKFEQFEFCSIGYNNTGVSIAVLKTQNPVFPKTQLSQ